MARLFTLGVLLMVGTFLLLVLFAATGTFAQETIECPKCKFVNPAKTPEGKDMSQQSHT